MIYWLTREDYASTVEGLCHGLKGHFEQIRPLSYEEVFFKQRAPRGHYIFSDFDRLSAYEVECAIALTDAIRADSFAGVILNDPRLVLERVPLLSELYRLGLNRFAVTRLDAGERPERYPVFIRSEDDCLGNDTPLLSSPEELECALEDLRRQGRTLKRRIAVEFCARADEKGRYRKYGATNIGGTIIPKHIMCSRDWNVKRKSSENDDDLAREELDFVRNNPHRESLKQIFGVARIDFGRIDYTLLDGRVQTFEINTNPTFPHFDGPGDARSERRILARGGVIRALQAIDAVPVAGGTVSFSLPKPRLQRPRLPRKAGFISRLHWAYKSLKR